MEELKFVLFYPVSICISGKHFKYGIKEGTFYPCLLGIIKEDNTLFDVISGRKFDIVCKEDKSFTEITFKSKVVANPVFVCRNIDNSLENVKFIEEYINAKGKISPDIIKEYDAFSYRLNALLSINKNNSGRFKGEGFWDSLRSYKSAKLYLRQIDNENLKSLEEFSYIQSGQKDIDDKHEKNEIVLRLKNRLLKK